MKITASRNRFKEINMRKTIVIVVAFIALTFAGCKSKEQTRADLSAAYQTANAQYQKDCSASPSDQDANVIVGAALGSKPSPQQQTGIDQRQHEAEARKNSSHCEELDAKRDELTKQMLAAQNQ
jgi:outer membrane murein-binding lipoprotein Lpp